MWCGVEGPVPSLAEGTPAAPILPTLFGPFRPPKPESRVHPFNNLFATSRRSVSVMTHIKFVASCLALPATADGSWTEVVILRPLWIRNVDFPKTIPALLKGCSTLLASPFHDRTQVPAKRISGKLLLPAPPGSGNLPITRLLRHFGITSGLAVNRPELFLRVGETAANETLSQLDMIQSD